MQWIGRVECLALRRKGLKMIKRLIENYQMAQSFNIKMNMVNDKRKDDRQYAIYITEKEIGILEYCASIGIETLHDIKAQGT